MATSECGHRAATPWGEGVHDMSWRDVLAVDDWAVCVPDHYIRVFPRLLPRAGAVPDCLVRHIAECLAVRAWRLGARHGTVDGLTSLDGADIAGIGRSRCGDWFVDRTLFARLVRRRRGEIDVAREHAAIGMLDGILADLQRGHRREGDDDTFAWFAFLTGIHPAYLWPAALASHERGTALGWLGYLDRGRRALMPDDVADFLTDVLDGGSGRGVTVRDPALLPFTVGIDVDALWRAAQSRRRHARPHKARSRVRLFPAAGHTHFAPAAHRGGAAAP